MRMNYAASADKASKKITSSLQRLLITIMKKSTLRALQPWKTFLHSPADKASANRGFTRIIATDRWIDGSLTR